MDDSDRARQNEHKRRHPTDVEQGAERKTCVRKDSAIIVLNKPPRVPVKGHLPVHNSIDILAAAAFSNGSEEGPKLVHRLDKESSGLLLLGRKKESVAKLHWLFTDVMHAKTSSQVWNDACERTMQRYWALVIGCPKEKEGVISTPLSKLLVYLSKFKDDSSKSSCYGGGTKGYEHGYFPEGSIPVPDTYPVPLRVHCAEALGTPIVGDYNYGWFVHKKWKQMPRSDYDPFSGAPYKLRRPEGLAVQKGSVLSKVPLLHLHCRELVIPNIAKFLGKSDEWFDEGNSWSSSKPDVLRFVAPMPSHMMISWNCMSSFLVLEASIERGPLFQEVVVNPFDLVADTCARVEQQYLTLLSRRLRFRLLNTGAGRGLRDLEIPIHCLW
ncbi:hypothetical protein KSP40_PGU010294 [Platanthera guangdongensis]|uniref:Pseudouridine synthase RsuA/RluA-like domain-containing protein n=1 Tax=Platanthera guangdongensis TaxID=2320717 RepID=A0ABR2LRM9_9ASPA